MSIRDWKFRQGKKTTIAPLRAYAGEHRRSGRVSFENLQIK
jgi:hypothetical protein